MEWQQKETIILNFIANRFKQIIQNNPTLPIRAGARAGAEISDILEDKFVEIANKQDGIVEAAGAPKKQTKSPYDIYFIYEFAPRERELVWIDIKATNLAYRDSNPDMGTYKKFLKFFKEGNYFAVYCKLAYLSEGSGLKFVATPHGEMVNVFLLKDIHHSFRIQPNNQLQVNYAAAAEPRSITEFIDLLRDKVRESLDRKQKKIAREIANLEAEFTTVKDSVKNTLLR